jgi:hypothetical protein
LLTPLNDSNFSKKDKIISLSKGRDGEMLAEIDTVVEDIKKNFINKDKSDQHLLPESPDYHNDNTGGHGNCFQL